jgi:quercetin 2,3-dioxygenase
VTRGRVQANGQTLGAGDGAAIEEAAWLSLASIEDAEVLVFDLK